MYGVLESGTGAIDGWYAEIELAENSKKYWDEIRPNHQHKIIKPVGEVFSIREPWLFIADL
jgi:hypothetical protein